MSKSLQPSTLDLIQKLSNERSALYRAKWSRRRKPGYRERIKELDRQIADLWHLHRCELAGSQKPPTKRVEKREQPRWDAETLWIWCVADASRSSTESEALSDLEQSYGIPLQNRMLADTLNEDNLGIEIVREVLLEIRQEEADRKGLIPLREKLAARGQTLTWIDHRSGSSYVMPLNALHT